MNTTFYAVCYLSFLMILGVLIRSKLKIFQELFIPASVIGGFVGLLLGPEVLGAYISLGIPKEWIKEISLLPGILIVPIVASIPLGLDFKGSQGKNAARDISVMGAIMFIVTFVQLGVGYLINFIFREIFSFDIYKSFGAELNAGFAGGHGTAGMIGRTLKDMNMDYWLTAQGIAATAATFGLVGGIILGVFLINRGCRKGETALLEKPSDIPLEMKKGFYTDTSKHGSLGRETMLSSSVDTLAFHGAIIFSVCGISYIILNFIKSYKIPILSSLSVWSIAMLVMFIVWRIIKKLRLEWCVDAKVKSRLSSFFTEFAVLAAISTLPLKAVFSHFLPITAIILVGFLSTWLTVRFLCYKHFKNNYPFERHVSILGTCLGVFLTGLVLLRICDPEFKTPVLGDYSLGFSITALTGPILIVSSIGLSLQYGAVAPILLNFSLILAALLFIQIVNFKAYKPSKA